MTTGLLLKRLDAMLVLARECWLATKDPERNAQWKRMIDGLLEERLALTKIQAEPKEES